MPQSCTSHDQVLTTVAPILLVDLCGRYASISLFQSVCLLLLSPVEHGYRCAAVTRTWLCLRGFATQMD
jgi:hypothetical protein